MWLQSVGRFWDSFFYSATFGRGRFYDYERFAFLEVASRLSQKTSDRLRHQISQVNIVSRIVEGREVNLYHISFQRRNFLPESLFENKIDDIHFATVQVLGADARKTPLKFEIWVVGGHIFQLIYSRAPKDYFGTRSLKNVKAEMVSCMIVADPDNYHPPALETAELQHDAALAVLRLVGGRQPADLRPPLKNASRTLLLNRQQCRYPADYIQLLTLTEGCTLGKWEILGATQIREVVDVKGNLIVIAEKSSLGVLALRKRTLTSELIFCDYINDSQAKFGASLVAAMNAVDERQAK